MRHMAWMNDYEYEFVQDSRDKKITARSARNMRTHNGKSGRVRLPSDYLTKKELKAMSGECIEYASLKKPMSWDEFKKLPDDLKKEYIINIRERFGAPDRYIGEMFGVSGATMGLYARDLGIALGKESSGGNRKWKKDEFYAWVTGADLNAPVPPIAPEAIDISTDTENEPAEPAGHSYSLSDSKNMMVPHDGQMVFTCPANQALDVINMLLGNTKVSIRVEWHVIEEEN